MSNLQIKELLKNYKKQNFNLPRHAGMSPEESRAENIRRFKENNPEIFKWFFETIDGSHSDNLLQSDLGSETFTTMLRFTDLIPGTRFKIVFSKDGEFSSDKSQIIHIGATGNYFADDLEPIYGIYLIKDEQNTSYSPISLNGGIAYQYSVPVRNSFDSIESIETDIGRYAQFVGTIDNLVEYLECTREQVTKISMSRYVKRPVEYLFYKGSDLSTYTEDLYVDSYDATGNYKELQTPYKDNLYWDTNYSGTFDDKEGREYSPFSIYVLRNSYVTVDGVKQNILQHIRRFLETTGETHTHVADHMFEKYYIDRYIAAQTAEDMLTERMALAARIAASQDEIEKAALNAALAAEPIYVADPIAGKVYKAGENYVYDPAIYYNNEQIDLREIQRYDLDNLEPTESKIVIGNGVYGEIYYQEVTMNYSFETVDDNLRTAKNIYEEYLANLKTKRANGSDVTRKELDELDNDYKIYNDILADTIKNWITRESDLELEE